MALALSWLLLQATYAEVQVRGNRLVPSSSVLHHAALGEVAAEPELAGAFRRLWETGLFEDIRFETEPIPRGLRLVIRVEEKPLLRDVRIEAERLPVEDLRESLRRSGHPLDPRSPLGEIDAREIARAAERLLGPDYQVEAALEPVSEDTVDLVLIVSRREVPRIENLRFVGNAALDDGELEEAMRLEESGFFSRFTRRDRYFPEVLEEDLERIRELYRSRGYARASVGPAEVEESPGAVAITIPIEEGSLYRFGSLEVDPGPRLSHATAASLLPTSGTIYDDAALDRVEEEITGHYFELGYALVRVVREETIVPGAGAIDVSLRVFEGPLLRTGFITFVGQERARDPSLRRFLDLEESERFDPREVERAAERLMSLGHFAAVTPEIDVESRPGRADVIFHVQERPRFEYLVGGGLEGVQGATGTGQLVARGLLGRLDRLRLETDLGNRFQNVALGYRDFATLGRRLYLAGDFRRSEIVFPDETEEELLDFALRAGGPWGGRWQFLAAFQASAFTLGSSLEERVPFLTEFLGTRFQTYRSAISLAHDTRDRPLLASTGRRLVSTYQLVAGDVELHRLRLEASQLLPLDRERRHLVAFSGRAEALRAFGESLEAGVPRFERLFLGSENDLRGFPIRGVGPREGSIVVGGDRLLFASAEYLYLLAPRLRLSGFFDLGNVFATDFEDQENPALRYDAGGEAQILLPLGEIPLRIGYGVNLDPRPEEPRGRFFVSLAVRF